MIPNLFLTIVYAFLYLLTAFFRALPDVTPDSFIATSINQASDSLGLIHSFLPNTINILLTVLGIMIVFELSYFTWKFISWIIRKIPGIN